MRYTFVFACLLSFIIFSSHVSYADINLQTVAKQAMVVDMQTGSVIYSKNADEKMPTSSMSKVMTMLVVFDALKDGRLSLDDKLLVSTKAWKKGGSKMFVGEGTRVSVEDLIKGVIVQSGNDATIVLAEGLAGSEDAFVQLINQKAQEIGMDNSHFTNASGWPDPDHYSTPRDLMKMAIYLINNYPEYYHYYGIKEFTYSGIKQNNRNPLLYRNLGADGIKTGHTDIAGYGLIGTAIQDDRRVIMVLNGLETDRQRRSESTRILAWVFNNTVNVNLFKETEIIDKVKVWLGKEYVSPVVTLQNFSTTVMKNDVDQIKATVIANEPIAAPITQGQELAKLRVEIPGNGVVDFPLYSARQVDEMNFLSKAVEKIRYSLSNAM